MCIWGKKMKNITRKRNCFWVSSWQATIAWDIHCNGKTVKHYHLIMWESIFREKRSEFAWYILVHAISEKRIILGDFILLKWWTSFLMSKKICRTLTYMFSIPLQEWKPWFNTLSSLGSGWQSLAHRTKSFWLLIWLAIDFLCMGNPFQWKDPRLENMSDSIRYLLFSCKVVAIKDAD